jgi:cyclic pyranopterin phosphate synthase
VKLSHIDKSGKAAMVNVAAKPPMHRTAIAEGVVTMAPETVRLVRENSLKKGDAFACARIAGIIAAKETSALIPLCHNLPLDNISVDIEPGDGRIAIRASAVCTGRTGVEMEALVSVSVAALTLYDMCKAVDKKMVIGEIRLVEKRKEPVHADL